MALNSLARESNLRDSVKKFLIDSIFTTENTKLSFDKGLSVPKIQGHEVTKWVAIQFGALVINQPISTFSLDIYCCTRSDPEGYQLSHLRDKVMGYLTDSSMPDSLRRIIFYKSNDDPWTTLSGKLLVYVDQESPQMEADDMTKFKIIYVTVKWGANV